MKMLLLFILTIVTITSATATMIGNSVIRNVEYVQDSKYYKNHSILGSVDGTLHSYPIEIVVNRGNGVDSGNSVFIDSNKVREDYGDVRFYDANNTSLSYYLLGNFTLDRRLRLVSPNPSVFIYASANAIGKLTSDDGLQFVQGWGSALVPDDGSVTGIIAAYKADGTVLWSYSSPGNDYPMGIDIGDLDLDGNNEVVACFRRNDSRCVSLNGATGVLLHSWSNTAGVYTRGVVIGKFTANAGNQIAVVDGQGYMNILDKNLNIIDSNREFPSGTVGQIAVKANLSGGAYDSVIVGWGRPTQAYIIAYDISSGEIARSWSYAIPGASNTFGIVVSTGLNHSSPADYAIAYTAQSLSNGDGRLGVIDKNGSLLWEKKPFLYSDLSAFGDTGGSSPGPITVADVNGDGVMEIITGSGWKPLTAAPPYGFGVISVFDLTGNYLYSKELPSSMTGDIASGDIDGDGVDDILAPNNYGETNIYNGASFSSAKFYVNVPNIPTTGTTIKIGYGNPNLSSRSNASSVFYFFDDFKSTSQWLSTGGSNNNILSGELGYFSSNGASLLQENPVFTATNAYHLFPSVLSTPTVIKFYFLDDSSSSYGKVYLSIKDSSGTINNAHIGMDSTISSTNYLFDSIPSSVTRNNNWREGKFVITSDGTEGFIDGVSIGTTNAINTTNAMRLALYDINSDVGHVSFIVSQYMVYPITTNEPVHGDWGNEMRFFR